jgi:hypothetical protein
MGDDDTRTRARIDGNDAVRHRRTDDVAIQTVLASVRQVLAEAKKRTK